MTIIYTCSNCDAQFPKWSGRCLSCGKWGTVRESIIDNGQLKNNKKNNLNIPSAKLIDLKQIKVQEIQRLKTDIEEIDIVFGGGIVTGSLTLIGGEPGIGKSTLVAQIASALSTAKIIYVSGEESANQIKLRLERLQIKLTNLKLINDTNVEKICSAIINYQPNLVIVDSIQTISSLEIESEAGSINQIRASAVKFLELAKNNNIAIILIGHITKDGSLAGPKSLEHIVDTVIYLETDQSQQYRLLRASKNRFGSTNEVGIFLMTSNGFEPIKDPSGIFLEKKDINVQGSVISAVMEGTRPFLIEIQALVTKTIFGYPQRKTSGFDINRLQVLSTVLTKKTKINLTTFDIILNLVGGLKINDPGLDLAVCLAIASSIKNSTISRKTIVLGEVGLNGEIRSITRLTEKLTAADKLGFKLAIIPEQKVLTAQNLKIKTVGNINEAIEFLEI